MAVLIVLWSAMVGGSGFNAVSVFAADEEETTAFVEEEASADDAESDDFASDDGEFDDGADASWEFEEDWDAAFDAGEDAEKPKADNFTWRVEAAFENIIQTDREKHLEEAWKKNEVSALFEFQYGTADDYLFSLTGLYFLPTFINDTIGDDYRYAAESDTSRNLRISGESSEIIFRELYYNWTRKKFRLRIGNQIYGWGTADFLNPTSYMNPTDFRELLFKDEDQVTLGVPSVSGLFFFKGFTVEAVFVPVHTASPYPETGDFWSVKQVEGSYPLIFGDDDPMEANGKNFGYGARLAATRSGVDFSVSGYHGPDHSPVLVPYSTVLIENQTVSILVQPEYFIVDYLGADMSFAWGDFTFQAEAAYSPNKSSFVKQDTTRPQELVFPYDTEKTDYLAYSLGFNYFIPLQKLLPGHAGESLFIMEWYQAQYFDDDVERPQITDFLTCRFQDTYLDDQISISMTAIFETRNSGVILWPQVGYDFQNGFKVEAGYVAIDGHGEGDYQNDSIFSYYNDNDFIMVNVRYAFP